MVSSKVYAFHGGKVEGSEFFPRPQGAVAVDMESVGVACAGHLNGSFPVLSIRGISDLADGAKAATDRAGWQNVAAGNAAAFAVALVTAILSKAEPVQTAGVISR